MLLRCAGLAAATALAACGGADDDAERILSCDEEAAAFTLTEPDGFIELLPGFNLIARWDPFYIPGVTVRLQLVEGERRIELPSVLAAIGELDTTADRIGDEFPFGIYRIEADFTGDCLTGAPHYDGDPLDRVFIKGLRFEDDTLALAAATPPPEIPYVMVSMRSAEVETWLDPTPGGLGGDELVIARTTIPGELVETARGVVMTGTTVDGAPVPSGTYRVSARIYPVGGGTYQEFRGPLLTWTAAN